MEEKIDINRELMLDANATVGLLYEIFGVEMTAAPTSVPIAAMKQRSARYLPSRMARGIILRCSGCEHVVLRIVQTPDEIILDARARSI